ncbi:putative membrane protein [Campylobacter sp. RM5004]|uniref:hypothetical protein n=1 Tax=Campylobacter sp. RM5004 TaxID=1660078 RepID=UPI001EFA711D|nr:hypothetical protein [Campylobacter sp. RM5004]ULO01339.1 putative membrane protein [Campylobacter sp. RM5004]
MNEKISDNQVSPPDDAKVKETENEDLLKNNNMPSQNDVKEKLSSEEELIKKEKLNNAWVKERYHDVLKILLSNEKNFIEMIKCFVFIYLCSYTGLLNIFPDLYADYVRSIGKGIVNLVFGATIFLLLFPLTFKIREHFKSILDVILEYYRKK